MRQSEKTFTAAIVGASGYGGGELCRLLANHGRIRVTRAVTDTFAGKPLADAFPGMAHTSVGKLPCERKANFDFAAPGVDIVFLAQENGFAKTVAAPLLACGALVIDLSADFRLTDNDIYRQFYKMEPSPDDLMARAVYGLPELGGNVREKLSSARLIANPGCHVTAATLALLPLLRAGVIAPTGIVIDSKTGISGAGRAKSDTIYRFSEADGAVRPYGVGGIHRHTPEIEQNLATVGGEIVRVTFVPQLVPMARGILATCYAPLKDGATTADNLTEMLRASYADEPFVIVRNSGDWPSTKDVLGSNAVHVCATVDPRTSTAIVVSVLDNLVKGAAGAAIQNANLALGLEETTGLAAAGLWP